MFISAVWNTNFRGGAGIVDYIIKIYFDSLGGALIILYTFFIQ